MTKSDQQALGLVALVGLAAAYLLLRDGAIKPTDAFRGGVPGTGRDSPGGTPPEAPESPTASPSVLEKAQSVIGAWIETVTGGAKPAPAPNYKSPSEWRAELKPLFRKLETSFAMPDGLLEAVADKESAFRHDIITGETVSSAGAEGIMQLMPQFHLTRPERLDPYVAIPYAARYLAKLFLRFGSWEQALAAYNWGPTALERNGIVNAPAETKNYIAWIKRRNYVADFV